MNVQRSLSTLNTTTEVPLSKAPNPQLLPGRRSINGCPLLRVCVHGVCVFTAVCVHLGWVKCGAQIPSMGHHTWSYVTYIYIYAFSRRFYPKRLTLHSSYSFYILSALAFPGNRTHDLGVASAMLYHLSYRKAYFSSLHWASLFT